MYQGISLDQAPPEDIPLRFFLTAPLGLMAFSLAALIGGVDFFTFAEAPNSIGLAHMLTLGWMAMIMIGAFYQMIPVMIGGRVPLVGVSRLVHALLTAGTLSMILFFLTSIMPLGEVAWISLASGFGLFLLQMAMALHRLENKERPTLSAMRTSLASLALTVILGLVMLAQWQGWMEPILESYQMRYMHFLFGFLGWIFTLVMGVSFHLIPMFFVTPGFEEEEAFRMVRLVRISLFLGAVTIALDLGHWATGASMIFALVGVGLYLMRILSMLNQRRRKRPDPTVTLFRWSAYFLVGGIFWFLLQLEYAETSGQFLWALVFLLGFGVMVTTGMLFKIFPFLIWFHRFSPLVGKEEIPMVDQLITHKEQFRYGWALLGSILLLLPSVLFLDDSGIRLAGLGLLLCSGWFVKLLLWAYFQEPAKKPEL